MDNLSEIEQQLLTEAKALEAKFLALLGSAAVSREIALAKTKIQEAIMWVEAHLKTPQA